MPQRRAHIPRIPRRVSGRISRHPISYQTKFGEVMRRDHTTRAGTNALASTATMSSMTFVCGARFSSARNKIPLADTSRMSMEGPSLMRALRSRGTWRHRRIRRRSPDLGVLTVATAPLTPDTLARTLRMPSVAISVIEGSGKIENGDTRVGICSQRRRHHNQVTEEHCVGLFTLERNNR